MLLRKNRILISESQMFLTLLNKRSINISFVEKPENEVKLSFIQPVIEDMKLRANLPCLRTILSALTDGKILLLFEQGNNSGLTYIPVMDKHNTSIVQVRVNISKFAKKKTTVDRLTGDMGETLDIPYEDLYTLLFGAINILYAQREYVNGNLVKILRTTWVDIVQQICNKTFGNPIYGDKFRFLLSYFFHDGEVTIKDMAVALKFDSGKANVLEATYPEFFSKRKDLTIQELLEVIAAEFPNMKGVTLDAFIGSSITMLGETGFYIVDNFAYYLGVCAVRCRKEGRNFFNGMLMRTIDANKTVMSSLMIQSM